MKFSTSTAKKVLILISLVYITNQREIEQCLSYEIFNSKKTCGLCYKSLPDPTKAACGPIPSSYNCDLGTLTKDGPACYFCNQGYIFTLHESDITQQCKKDENPIENCVIRTFNPGNNAKSCLLCDNGTVPAADQFNCVKPAEELVNCKWASRAAENYCFRCNEGYVYDTEKKICVEYDQANLGCLIQYKDNNTQCLVCNGYDGYFMKEDRSCAKASSGNDGNRVFMAENLMKVLKDFMMNEKRF